METTTQRPAIRYDVEFISGEYRIAKYDNNIKVMDIWSGPREVCLNGAANLNRAEFLYHQNKFMRFISK